MDNAKIKNYLIIVLLLLNICLGVLVGLQHSDARLAKRSMQQSVSELLDARGISMHAKLNLDAQSPGAAAVLRSTGAEQQAAEQMLQNVTVSNQSDGSIMYNGKNGQAVFRQQGQFELLMTESSFSLGKNPAATGARLMSRMGISSRAEDATVSEEPGSCTVTMTAAYNDCPILNCQVTFTFTGGNLLLAVGQYPPEVVTPGTANAGIDACTALIRALAVLDAQHLSCSELTGLDLCYLLSSDETGTGLLNPIWRVQTDAGNILISAITGESVSYPSDSDE